MGKEQYGVDLHVHTTASDGYYSPMQILEYADANQLKAVAITDHDTVEGIKEIGNRSEEFEVELIPGVEFTTNYEQVVHILGINLNIYSSQLTMHLKKVERKKLFLLAQALKFVKSNGIECDMDAILNEKKAITILNVKNYLLEKNITNNGDFVDSRLKEIIDEWIESMISPQECIQLIHSCGGKAVLAHPIHLSRDRSVLKNIILKFKHFGLDGIEVQHPDHSAEDMEVFNNWAEELRLLKSGGSDFHGIDERNHLAPGNSTEDGFVPYSYLVKIKGE